MDEIYCEIVSVAEILRDVVVRNNDADDERLQILRCHEAFRKSSPNWPRCASCDAFVFSTPKSLAIFRTKGNPAFGVAGLCDKCLATLPPAAIMQEASRLFSAEFGAGAGSA